MNPPSPSPLAAGLSLDQWIALNDEIAALVRAGIPLERGLREVSRDLPGKLGSVTGSVAERIERGESLAQAIAAEGNRFPSLYRAVVEAGIQGGRLPAALESLSSSARRISEVRQAITTALVYPLIVLFVAYGLLLVYVSLAVPRLDTAFEYFELPRQAVLAPLDSLGESISVWAPAFPLVVLLLVAFWLRITRVGILGGSGVSRVLNWCPWVGKVLAHSRLTQLTEVLALLLEQRVPLADAVRMAGDASGDRKLAAAGQTLAARIAQGAPLDAALRESALFPPLLSWHLATGAEHSALAPAVRHAAEIYHRRTLREAAALRLFLPTFLTIAIGGAATLLFALSVFAPMSVLFQGLAD